MKVTKENIKVYYNGNLVRIHENDIGFAKNFSSKNDLLDIVFYQTAKSGAYDVKFMYIFDKYDKEEFDKLTIELSKFIKDPRDHNITIFVNNRKMDIPYIKNINIDHNIVECKVTYTVTIHSDSFGRPHNYNYKIIPYDPADYPGLLDLEGEKNESGSKRN